VLASIVNPAKAGTRMRLRIMRFLLLVSDE
jgi:hypothetical protein